MNEKELKEFFIERSEQIYQLRYSKELKKANKEKTDIQQELLDFLKQRLTNEDYEIAFKHIDSYSQISNHITGLWNEKFYFSGLKDSQKYKN